MSHEIVVGEDLDVGAVDTSRMLTALLSKQLNAGIRLVLAVTRDSP